MAKRRSSSGRGRLRLHKKKNPAKSHLQTRTLQQKRILAIAGVAIALAGLLLVWIAFALSREPEGTRMSPFHDAPATARNDLLWLSYLDSLARADRAVPTALNDSVLLVRQLVERAGISRRTAETWALFPAVEEGHSELNELFRELNRRRRILLPLYGEALWTHLRERRLHPGYLVFGQTPRAAADEADLCAIITAVNSIQPEYSVLLYRDPATGALIHGDFGDMPEFGYLGGGRLGDDVPAVYRQYFQLRDARSRKPLY